jgi:hypothetical protein
MPRPRGHVNPDIASLFNIVRGLLSAVNSTSTIFEHGARTEKSIA